MRLVVDLTPLLPGGANGGAKPMVLSLLQNMPELRPDWEFVLLTSQASHEELAFLDRPNVELRCVQCNADRPAAPAPLPRWHRWLRRGYQWMSRMFPERVAFALRRWYYRYGLVPFPHLRRPSLVEQLGADLLFCPFSDPHFHVPGIPTVSIIYDLQFMAYPRFFSPAERRHRHRYLSEAVRLSTHLVTISEFVRQTVLENFSVSPERVTAIPIGLPRPLPALPEAEGLMWLGEHGLKPQEYLLYPANFWPHKNHEALLTAFNLFHREHPAGRLKLVLTGALEERRRWLEEASRRMGVGEWVIFPGFLPLEVLGTLYRHALALVFPSLYEGFGIPVLEAMTLGVPVLCGRVTSLPEVAGDAALYFDPRKPAEIAAAIERVAFDESLRADLIARGSAQAARFGGPQALAEAYVRVLERTLYEAPQFSEYGLDGMAPDHWLRAFAVLTFPSAEKHRLLEMRCALPSWMPFPMTLRVLDAKGKVVAKKRLSPGQEEVWQLPIPAKSGFWRFVFHPPYRPGEWQPNSADKRKLGMQCRELRVLSDEVVLWEKG